MRFTSIHSELPGVVLAIWAGLCSSSMALAQVETIEPNPTQPYDIDTDFPYGSRYGGAHIGRGPARPGQPREENPAETMLREIEGTNYEHYTGHVLGTMIRGGRPENRWRYRFYRGRWWYWTPTRRWEFFDGRRWLPYSAHSPTEKKRETIPFLPHARAAISA